MTFKIPFAFCLFILLISQTNCQNPIPVNFNISILNGEWYLTFVYQSNYSGVPTGFNCFAVNIDIDLEQGIANFNQTVTEFNTTQNILGYYSIESNTSVWKDNSGNAWEWIGIDPISSSWAVFASKEKDEAVAISRAQNITIPIVLGISALLKTEGYSITPTDYFMISNHC